jgi:hypothetical protein
MPKAKVKQALKPYPLRLPEDLYEAIAAIAEAEVRPVNSQIIVMLREAVARQQSPAKAKEKRASP